MLGCRVCGGSQRLSGGHRLAGAWRSVSEHRGVHWAVTSYIHFCKEVCVPSCWVKIFQNNKLWFTPCLHAKLQSREKAFKSSKCASYKKAKYEVQRAIWGAEIIYWKQLEDKFLNGDEHAIWQGLQSVFNYKRESAAAPDNNPKLADKLNSFYARFDHLHSCHSFSALPSPFIMEECKVRQIFRKQNSCKAAGPDSVSSSTLKYCADQLAPVLKLLKCCFTSTETVGLLGMGAQDGHLDFHTAPELCPCLHHPLQLRPPAQRGTLLLQGLRHHPGAQETKDHHSKWLQTSVPHLSGDENVGAADPEVDQVLHQWPAWPTTVYFLWKLICWWCSHTGPVLHPPGSWLSQLLCLHPLSMCQ